MNNTTKTAQEEFDNGIKEEIFQNTLKILNKGVNEEYIKFVLNGYMNSNFKRDCLEYQEQLGLDITAYITICFIGGLDNTISYL